MEHILKTLPTWLIILLACYVAVLVSYAVFDNRTVALWPPVIHSKDEPSDVGPTRTRLPWVSLETVTPQFSTTECPVRLPASLGMASATNVKPATWGERGTLWFAELNGNTVWLFCPRIAATPVIIVGAAGKAPDSTKTAVDLLAGLISR
jgi:hypothetical protein